MMRLILCLIFLLFSFPGFSQTDSAIVRNDSIPFEVQESKKGRLQILLDENTLLNSGGEPESLAVSVHHENSREFLFYALGIILLFFGMIKTFYSRYLANLFRVFFNTSLRQSQLTDQLLQAKLPSLFFNLFFVLMGGFFLYFIFRYLGYGEKNDYMLLLWCITGLAVMYSVKYVVLKFSGWVTGFSYEADIYIFIIFLINKMLGMLLMPIVILLAFTEHQFFYPVMIAALVLIALMILFRFVRSYALLGHRIKVSRIHFVLYIIGIEILPVLLILKVTGQLLEKS